MAMGLECEAVQGKEPRRPATEAASAAPGSTAETTEKRRDQGRGMTSEKRRDLGKGSDHSTQRCTSFTLGRAGESPAGDQGIGTHVNTGKQRPVSPAQPQLTGEEHHCCRQWSRVRKPAWAGLSRATERGGQAAPAGS